MEIVRNISQADLSISIVGLGKVGRQILSILLAHTDNQLEINALDPSPEVRGSMIDLGQASALRHRHNLLLNDLDAFEHSDFIFYAAGKSIPLGRTRKFNFKRNLRIADDVFSGIKFKSRPYVIVLTNPVEIMTNYIGRKQNLNPEQVLGTGTLIDSVRINYFLSQTTGIPIDSIETRLVGEHGASMALLEDSSRVMDAPMFDTISKEDFDGAMNHVLDSANRIKLTQGASFFGAAHCAILLFEHLLSTEPELTTVTSWNTEHRMHISQLIEMSSAGIKAQKMEFSNEGERAKFERAIRHIRSSLEF